MSNSKKSLTLLTGATSGIGLELAKRLVLTDDLVVVGRKTESEAHVLISNKVQYIQADISSPKQAVEVISSALQNMQIDKIDRVIHCAGTGVYTSPEQETVEQIDQNVSVNLLFPVLLTRALVPQIEVAKGKVVLIGSVAHKGSSNMASYAASKAGLAGFARSLEAEWRGRIDVQVIHPGPTLTPMLEKAGYTVGMERHLFLSPQVMADAVIKTIHSRKKSATIFLGAKIKSLLFRKKNA
ncbi:MAG: SDR family oxidoreductase [Lentilitoribacter sp.]